MNLAIGRHGAALLPENANVLTVCNTGGLATSGHGTALGIIRTGFEQGKVKHVYSCETRPRMQGLRLTAYELKADGIPFHSIADGVAASLMRAGKVDCVIAGADRIAVMAALNITHELLAAKTGAGFDIAEYKRRMSSMNTLVDEALATQEKLF